MSFRAHSEKSFFALQRDSFNLCRYPLNHAHGSSPRHEHEHVFHPLSFRLTPKSFQSLYQVVWRSTGRRLAIVFCSEYPKKTHATGRSFSVSPRIGPTKFWSIQTPVLG
jgi:hypothetical protein